MKLSRIKKRQIWGVTMAFVALFLCGWVDCYAVSPNMVIMMADDLGYGDLSCMGSQQIQTPNIDSLARDGVLCSRAYVTAPMCSPSRMGMLTGRFPKRFGITNNPNSKMDYLGPTCYGLPRSEQCFPEYLKPLGYTSAIIGKWHLGEEPGWTPIDRGFDTWWGFLGGGRHYTARKRLNRATEIVSNYDSNPTVTHLTDDIARESIRFIESRQGKKEPFFLFVSFNAPHTPHEPLPEDLQVMLAKTSDKKRAKYGAMILGVDRAVGNILKALDRSGYRENTIVAFLSDNGGELRATACNAPLRGGKRLHYEGGVRVPLLVRYPADSRIRPGSVCRQVVSSLDFLPTLLKLNEVKVPGKLDGQDMMPTLRGESVAPRTLFWCTDYAAAIMHGSVKYLTIPGRLPEMYDIANDPQEECNLLPNQAGRASQLAEQLGEFQTSTPPMRFPDSSTWSNNLMHQYGTATPGVQPPVISSKNS